MIFRTRSERIKAKTFPDLNIKLLVFLITDDTCIFHFHVGVMVRSGSTSGVSRNMIQMLRVAGTTNVEHRALEWIKW